MRHFELLRFLAFATSPDSLHSSHVALQQSSQQQNRHSPTSKPTSLVRRLSSAVESHREIVQGASAEQEEKQTTTRRRALSSIFAAAGGSLAFVGASNALDMDAFVNSQVRADNLFVGSCRRAANMILTHTLTRPFHLRICSSNLILKTATQKETPNANLNSRKTKPCASTVRAETLEVRLVSESKPRVEVFRRLVRKEEVWEVPTPYNDGPLAGNILYI